MTTLDPKWGTPDPTHDPQILANFKARSTDILITTAPKAGTTWMQQILHQIRSGGDSSFDNIDDVVPWLELPREGKSWQQTLGQYESLSNPRIFKTHCTYAQTPGTDKIKIILSSRDPRDCCVSFYHHIKDMTDEARAKTSIPLPDSFDEYFNYWLEGESWFRNVKSWWPHKDDDNVLWLRYEDMKKDFPQSLDKILHFLDWKVTSEQRSRISQHCSFEWMKEHVNKFTHQNNEQKPVFKPHGFIRKGQVGDHKTVMTEDQMSRIMDKAVQMLDPGCLLFLDLA